MENVKNENVEKYAPHQMRVIEEQKELDIKIINLQKFIENNFNNIVESVFERQDLVEQLDYMNAYSECLKSRINRFI